MSFYQIKTLHLLIINRPGKAMGYKKEIFGKILSRAGPPWPGRTTRAGTVPETYRSDSLPYTRQLICQGLIVPSVLRLALRKNLEAQRISPGYLFRSVP